MGAIAGRVQGAGYPNEETPASPAIFPNLMLHPGAGGWFTQQHWPLTPQSHRWTAHYYYHEPVNMTERLAIAQATAFARDISEEHTSELQSLMRISYAVFCLKKQQTYTSQYHKIYQY